ncbi:MarR family winged helix-turn-helix transcriptional regulator [Bordetella sp. BOR01]|uniref:MarR family winged helix-turn-helix transcriptional regulator n=1 Tax=Bordetella sp. BOR01 TaxID=2854779 RepID=UPI001C4695B3|nr:MarR family transcriptional regulator [Bordetella sp. BOR01]MBV7482647.1 MarR family transcriptional regulator [Bordetella sp. BOR01]
MTDSLRAQFASSVAQAARSMRRAVDRRLQPYGLTEATWLPLLHLSRSAGPMRQKDLAASLGLDSSSVVRLIDALQAAGLVQRKEEDQDRRAKSIVLTARGQATVAQVERVAKEVRDNAMSDIPDAELQRAGRLLARLRAALEADIAGGAP